MNYTPLIKAVKDIIMQIPTSRLVLLWTIAISCIATWRAADIIQVVAELAK